MRKVTPRPTFRAKKKQEPKTQGSLYEEARFGALQLAKSIYKQVSGKLVLRADQMVPYATEDHLIKVLCCGRRWGKTTYCCAESLRAAAVPESLVWWTSPTYGQGERPRMVLDYITRKMGIQSKVTKHYITLKNGSQISFRSVHDASSLRGSGVNVLIMDEAVQFREKDFSQVLLPMMMDTHGRCIMVSTPGAPRGFFYESFLRGQPGPKRDRDFISFRYPSDMNPLNDHEWMELQKRIWGAEFTRECMAQFIDIEEFEITFDGGTIQQFVDWRNTWDADGTYTTPKILSIDGSGIGKVGWVYGVGSKIIKSGAETMPRPDYLFDFAEEKVLQYTPNFVVVDSTANNTGLYPYLGRWCREREEKKLYAPRVIGCNFAWLPKEPQRFANWRTENLFLTRDLILGKMLACMEKENRDLLSQMELVRSQVNDTGKFKARPKKHRGEEHSEDTVDAAIMYAHTLDKYGIVGGTVEEPAFDINELYRRTSRSSRSLNAGRILIA